MSELKNLETELSSPHNSDLLTLSSLLPHSVSTDQENSTWFLGFPPFRSKSNTESLLLEV
jgi:hypothetical protein